MIPMKSKKMGRLAKRSSVRPAVEVDCSSWAIDTPPSDRPAGRFVTNSSVGPAVEVNSSEWTERLTSDTPASGPSQAAQDEREPPNCSGDAKEVRPENGTAR